MSTISGEQYRAWAEVDLSALDHNIGWVRKQLPPATGVISVVKADAYGHGVGPVVERLSRLGLQGYAVASPLEGGEVRAQGIKEPIIVFGPVFPPDLERITRNDLSVTVSSQEEVDVLRQALKGTRSHIRVHLKVDTGMGRMGVPFPHMHTLYASLANQKNIKLEGVYTHFSSAGEEEKVTSLQRTRFSNLLADLSLPEGIMIHADNSAGATIFDCSGPWNAVRLGLIQYGCKPYALKNHDAFDLRPVLSAHARVGLVKCLPKGSAISYGGTHRLTRDSKVAVVTVGYADGVSRQRSNRGSMLIKGYHCPVLGRVCMDLTVLDVTDHPEHICPGERVTWIGTQGDACISAEDVSAWANTIPWESLCAISKRVPRIYIN